MRTPKHMTAASPRGRTVLVIAVCRAGIVVVTLAYVLLLIATVLGIVYPRSIVGKVVALVAYSALVVFFLYRSYRTWCRETARRSRVLTVKPRRGTRRRTSTNPGEN